MFSSLLYRLGRKLYTTARKEIAVNEITINGEAALQKRIIETAINERVVLFDVGANLGEWSIRALQLPTQKSISIHSFEPVADTFVMLQRNTSAQPLINKSLKINQLAVSNKLGTQTIHITGKLAGNNSLHTSCEATTTETIQLTTIDTYCREYGIDHVNLLKIDIEGHDFFAIQGAKNMLKEQKIDILQFEYNHRWVFSRCFLKDVFDFCQTNELAYTIGKLTGDGIFFFQDWHYELEKFFEGNYVFVRNDLVSQIQGRFVQFDQYNALV